MDNQEKSFCLTEKERNKFFFFAILLFTALIAFLLAATANKIKATRFISRDLSAASTINVSGTGEVFVKPDIAVIDFSVITEGSTVTDVIQQNTEKINRVIGFIKSQGVEDKYIKTINYQLNPLYVYAYSREGHRSLTGYELTQILEVRIKNLDKVGALIQGATTVGVNQVSNIRFTVEDEELGLRQAREQAISKAKANAHRLAKQLGVRLVRLLNYNEFGGPVILEKVGLRKFQNFGGESMPAPAPQIQPGENKIQLTVNLTYEIE